MCRAVRYFKMKSFKEFQGSVFIDGKQSYNTLTPTIDELGFSLYRLKSKMHNGHELTLIEDVGPHFNIWVITPSLFIKIVKGSDYRFSGPSLGSKAAYHGYFAADIGSSTRLIKDIVLNVFFNESSTVFDITGSCGCIINIGREAEKYQPSTEEFSIHFSVPDNEIVEWFPQGEYLLKQKHASNQTGGSIA